MYLSPFSELEIQRNAQVPAGLVAIVTHGNGFPVAGRHAFTPLHRRPVTFGDARAPLDIVPVPGRHQHLPLLIHIVPALDQDSLAMNHPPATLVADRVAHFIAVRAPDLLANRLIHRLAPDSLDFCLIDRLYPHLVADRAINRLDPYPAIFNPIAAIVVAHIDAILAEADRVAVAVRTIAVISIRLGQRGARAQ